MRAVWWSWRSPIVPVGAALAAASVMALDALEQAQRQYREESRSASEAFTKRMTTAGTHLLDTYDRLLRSTELDKDEARKKVVECERVAIAEAIERLRREGPQDPVADLLSAMDGATMEPGIPRDGLAAYYGMNEGRGRRTFDAIRRTSHEVGDAEWTVVDGTPVLDFQRPASAVDVGSVALGAEWTAVVRAKLPVESQGHEWATLMLAGIGRHHVIISRDGELGVFRDQFFGSGVRVNSGKGWHVLVIRASQHRTSFFLDGQLKGVSAAAVTEPVTSICNGPWSTNGNPQNVATQVDGVLLYSRAMTDAEIGRLEIRRL